MQELPGKLEDSITDLFYELSDKLRSLEGLVRTLGRLEILTDDEQRVIYHNSHSKIIEQMRQA